MPPYGGRVSRWVTSPFYRGVASNETELIRSPEGRSAPPRVGPLPSSEAEARCAIEGSGGGASSEAEIAPRVRGGFGWAAPWSQAVGGARSGPL